MNTFIVHPKNQAQEKAVKAVLEALNIAFEKIDTKAQDEEFILPPHVVQAVKKSEEQIKNGQSYSYNQVKDLIAKR